MTPPKRTIAVVGGGISGLSAAHQPLICKRSESIEDGRLRGGAPGAVGLPDCIAPGEAAADPALDSMARLPRSTWPAASEG